MDNFALHHPHLTAVGSIPVMLVVLFGPYVLAYLIWGAR